MPTYSERLELANLETYADGNVAYCYFATVWRLETNHGTETVETDVCDPQLPDGVDELPEEFKAEFADYIEGTVVYSAERVDQWLTHWSMPGYLDRGSEHTGDTESDALAQLLEYDGGMDDGPIPEWAMEALVRLAELADDGDELAAQTVAFYL